MWIYQSLLLLLLTMAAALDAHRVPGSQRIVNGQAINIKSVPWQVALLDDGLIFCGGVILAETIILTAAECLSNRTSVENLTVRAASTYWRYGGQLVKVADFKIHGHYGDESRENDIAIVLLGRPLNLAGDLAQKINCTSESPNNNADAFVAGWGASNQEDSNSLEDLHGVQLKIVDRASCSQSLYAVNGFEITKDMICATGHGKGACGTDLGGALISDGKLAGLVSWSSGCAKRGYPGVYANVVYLGSWIRAAAREFGVDLDDIDNHSYTPAYEQEWHNGTPI